jgi:hypothetical protein
MRRCRPGPEDITRPRHVARELSPVTAGDILFSGATIGHAACPHSDSQQDCARCSQVSLGLQRHLTDHLRSGLRLVPESNVEIAPLFEIGEERGLSRMPTKTFLS